MTLSLPDSQLDGALNEQIVLSALMYDDIGRESGSIHHGKLLIQYGPFIQPEWFLLTMNRLIFEAILRIHEAGGICSLPSVAAEILARKEPVPMHHLAEVYGCCSSPYIELPYHLERMVRGYIGRTLARTAQDAAKSLKGGNDPSESMDALSGILESLRAISASPSNEAEAGSAKNLAHAFQERRMAWSESPGEGWGWPLGIAALKPFQTRLYRSQRLVIAGEPNVGKSTLTAQIALQAAVHFGGHEPGVKVGVLSIEDGKERWVDRAISHLSQVPLSRMRDATYRQGESAAVDRAEQVFATLPLIVETHADLTIEQLPSVIQSLVNRGCAVVVVDYLQDIASTKSKDLREKVTAAVRSLKMLAIKLDIALIIVSSLRKLNGARPTLDDLKESGDIGFVASEVLALWVAEPGETPESPVLLGLDVLKQKDGPKGSTRLLLRGQVFRLETPAREHEPEEPAPRARPNRPFHRRSNDDD